MRTKIVGLLGTLLLGQMSMQAQLNDSTISRFTFSYSFFHYLEPPNKFPFKSVSGVVLGGVRMGYEFSLSENPYSVDIGIDVGSNTSFEFATPDAAKRAVSVYVSANKIIYVSNQESNSISAYLGIRLSYSHYWANFYQYDPNATTGDQRRASQKLVGSESQTVEQFGPNVRTKFQFSFLPVKIEFGYAPNILAFTDNTLRFQYSHMFEMLLTL